MLAAEILAAAAKNLLDLGRLDLARHVGGLAVAENAQCANAHSVLGVVHDALAEWQDGFEHSRRAVELQPGSPQLEYNLALSTLRLDDYAKGFAWMEARIDKPDWTGFAIAPSRAAERHRLLHPGDPVDRRRILVIIEQGLGDCIMFARYLPLLAARGARITLACSPPLRPLFERVAGIEVLLAPPPEQPLAKINLSLAEFDEWVPLLSLPYYFRTEFASVPAEIPYLSADPVRIAVWRERYEATGRRGTPKVGFVFQANPQSGSSADRSLSIADLAPLLRIAEIDPVNLQGGAAGRQLAAEYPDIIDATNPDFARRVRCRSGGNRPGDHCRHHGGALRGRFGPSGMDHGSLFAALVLGGRTRSDALVSDSAAVSPEFSTGLVEFRRENGPIFEANIFFVIRRAQSVSQRPAPRLPPPRRRRCAGCLPACERARHSIWIRLSARRVRAAAH